MKAGAAVILFTAVIAVAVGIMEVMNPPAETPQADTKPRPMVQRQWRTSFDGHTVTCGIAGTDRWQIMFPTLEERQEGVQPLVDQAPTDDVWAQACGPSDPG